MAQRSDHSTVSGDENGGEEHPTSPVVAEIEAKSTESAVAVIGHPVHAMLVHFPIALAIAVLGCDLLVWITGDPFFARAGTWAAGGAFLSGALASLVGIVEVLLVPGIRARAASWTHASAGMTFLAALAASWGLRLVGLPVVPDALALSLICTVLAGVAGYHGGKLIFEEGIGINMSRG
ncbi:DUF2231 domain-containing protein [Paracoccus sp. S-4012]|uniref:DUF2231 domain-containing protein n=1 Tax=Paracoccus sp. S-4012 TaxID=2665648 RepID=UPI0012AF38BE|nr:DUF2231 domain-containing protein [Paracoccus sp. S-4012]MRX50672.1 DUF2231 domain-containing protein [Paracoccus sp. S-4012]